MREVGALRMTSGTGSSSIVSASFFALSYAW